MRCPMGEIMQIIVNQNFYSIFCVIGNHNAHKKGQPNHAANEHINMNENNGPLYIQIWEWLLNEIKISLVLVWPKGYP